MKLNPLKETIYYETKLEDKLSRKMINSPNNCKGLNICYILANSNYTYLVS